MLVSPPPFLWIFVFILFYFIIVAQCNSYCVFLKVELYGFSAATISLLVKSLLIYESGWNLYISSAKSDTKPMPPDVVRSGAPERKPELEPVPSRSVQPDKPDRGRTCNGHRAESMQPWQGQYLGHNCLLDRWVWVTSARGYLVVFAVGYV